MSARTRLTLLVVALSCASATAVAQQSGAREAGKWEIEVHAGGVRMGKPTDATTALPPPGDAFTTLPGRPSRLVSSWYFGDGAVLFNQWAAAFTIAPRLLRITPLDPALTGSAARSSNAGSFGLRVGRRLTPRFTVEANVDFRPTRLELSDSAMHDIEAARSTFANAWNEELTSGGFAPGPVVSSTSQIDEGTGGQIVTTGALTVKLRRGGVLVPHVTGGLGGVFNRGRAPSVTLTGNYAMSPSFAPLIRFNEIDTVTVRFVRPDRALVGVVGGGFTYDFSRRYGFRVDLQLHVSPNAVDTEVGASPFVATGTPTGSTSSATSPSVAFSNSGSGGTFRGPVITNFKTRDGSGWQIDTALTVGYFWRF